MLRADKVEKEMGMIAEDGITLEINARVRTQKVYAKKPLLLVEALTKKVASLLSLMLANKRFKRKLPQEQNVKADFNC